MRTGYFGSSWRLADNVFAPRGLFLHWRDEEMRALRKWRGIIGGLIVLCVAVHYHDIAGVSTLVDRIFQGLNRTMVVAFCSVIPATVVVVLFTNPGRRTAAFKQMRYPAAAFGGYAVFVFLAELISESPVRIMADLGLLGALLMLVYLIFLPWLLSFTLRMWYQMGTGMFRLEDGHPLLPPVVSVLAAWATVFMSLLDGGTDESEPAVIVTILLIGGPISITALAIYEIMRLKERYPHHFPFRDGPLT